MAMDVGKLNYLILYETIFVSVWNEFKIKVWNCAYGIDIDCQNKPDNEYLDRIKAIFDDDFNRSPIVFTLSKLIKNVKFIFHLIKIYSFWK